MTFPNHVEHFRGTSFSYDRTDRRNDATERRTDAEVMSKIMSESAPDAPAKSDPERDAVVARLKQEGRSDHDTAKFLEGYDISRPRTEAYDAKLRGLKEGTDSARAKQTEIEAKAAAEEKRTDASDCDAMARAMRSAGTPESLIKPAVHVAPRTVVSASDRARVANDQRMRTAWYPPTPGPAQDTRHEVRDQRSAASQFGPRVSASERAKRENEERQRTAWLR